MKKRGKARRNRARGRRREKQEGRKNPRASHARLVCKEAAFSLLRALLGGEGWQPEDSAPRSPHFGMVYGGSPAPRSAPLPAAPHSLQRPAPRSAHLSSAAPSSTQHPAPRSAQLSKQRLPLPPAAQTSKCRPDINILIPPLLTSPNLPEPEGGSLQWGN